MRSAYLILISYFNICDNLTKTKDRERQIVMLTYQTDSDFPSEYLAHCDLR